MNRNGKRILAGLLTVAFTLLAIPAAAAAGKVVNINTASVEQLSLLPRIGPAVAARIVDFRAANGAFKATEELMLVRGIGERSFELLKPYLATSGETTLDEKVRVPRAPKAGEQD